jgi:tRNA modification GTPase
VVSAVAGTTRDAIWAEMRLARGMVRLVDVAGIEEAGSGQWVAGSAEAEIARQMHEQAMKAVETADGVVWVEDGLRLGEKVELGRGIDLVVLTKFDLLDEQEGKDQKLKMGKSAGIGQEDGAGDWKGVEGQTRMSAPPVGCSFPAGTDANVGSVAETYSSAIWISAKSGAGIETLRASLDRLAFGAEAGVGLALNARHVTAIAEAQEALSRAMDAVEAGAEVVAMELREVLDALGGVLGKISPDELLGRVFSRFCIGK